MVKATRVAIGAGGVLVALLLGGFVLFANVATRRAPAQLPRADGIVVLTGGGQRIETAIHLLREGSGRRLLISGVNRQTTREEVRRLVSPAGALFDCCVDIGYEALDTAGNADETRAWVERHAYAGLIVVTASYHMPRSLAEIGRALPGVRLVPYPVVPKGLQLEPWWLHYGATRILASEYLKFLPSALRYATSRLVHVPDHRAPDHAGTVAVSERRAARP
jgi:uncharacterized SAM-binding protein YcdF (DUF218 family)